MTSVIGGRFFGEGYWVTTFHLRCIIGQAFDSIANPSLRIESLFEGSVILLPKSTKLVDLYLMRNLKHTLFVGLVVHKR